MWQWVLGIGALLLALFIIGWIAVWLYGMHPIAPLSVVSCLAWWPTLSYARRTRNSDVLYWHFLAFAVLVVGFVALLKQPIAVGAPVVDTLALGWFAFVALAAAAATPWTDALGNRARIVAAGVTCALVAAFASYHYVAFPRGPQTPPQWVSNSGVAEPAITPEMRQVGFSNVDVQVAFWVDRSGHARHIRVVDNPSGDEAIDAAARDAVARGRFPRNNGGGHLGYWANTTVSFALQPA